MLFLRRFFVAIVVLAIGVVGGYVHALKTIGFDAASPEAWELLGWRIKAGRFDEAASLGTIGIIWGVGALVLGYIGIAYLASRTGQEYGRATWASGRQARKLGLIGAFGVVLGRIAGKVMREGEKATLIVGPPGTGKSTGVFMPTLLDGLGQASAFVHDVKGELAKITGAYRETLGPVWVVNPSARRGARWNPLGSSELPQDDAQLGDLIETYWSFLLKDEEGGKNSHFKLSGRQVGTAVTLLIIYKARQEGREATFQEVLEWLSGVMDQESLAEIQHEAAGDDGEEIATPLFTSVFARVEGAVQEVRANCWPERIVYGLGRLIQAAKEERGGIISTAYGALGPWLNQNIAWATTVCDFSVHDYRGEKPVTVYWITPPLKAEIYTALTGMHIEALMVAATNTLIKAPRKITLLIDEAAFLPALDVVSVAPAIARGYGVQVVCGVQDIAQLIKKYGKTSYDAMIGNFGVRVYFPQNNLATAKEISETIGDATRIRQSVNIKDADVSGESLGREARRLVTASDIMSLKAGKALVLSQYFGQKPFLVDVPYYYKERRLRKRAKMTSETIKNAL